MKHLTFLKIATYLHLVVATLADSNTVAKNADNQHLTAGGVGSSTSPQYYVVGKFGRQDQLTVFPANRKYNLNSTTTPNDNDNRVQVKFINLSSQDFRVNFIADSEPGDDRTAILNISPKANSDENNQYSMTIKSFIGNKFAVFDEDHTFRLVRVVTEENIRYTSEENEKMAIFRITDDMINLVRRKPAKQVEVTFINEMEDKNMHVFYIDMWTQEEHPVILDLSPRSGANAFPIQTFEGHKFAVYCDKFFRGIYRVPQELAEGDILQYSLH